MSSSGDPPRLQYLVLDAGALIQGAALSLYGKAECLVTTPEVLGEIRDRRAREQLAALPFELETRSVAPAALQRVVAFARKTGDLASLSTTDLRVLALTYQLEAEVNGDGHLRLEPLKSGTRVQQGVDGATAVQRGDEEPAMGEDVTDEEADEEDDAEGDGQESDGHEVAAEAPVERGPPTSWKELFPADAGAPVQGAAEEAQEADPIPDLEGTREEKAEPAVAAGQFDDAEESSDGEDIGSEEASGGSDVAEEDAEEEDEEMLAPAPHFAAPEHSGPWTRNSWAVNPFGAPLPARDAPAPTLESADLFPSLGDAREVFKKEQEALGVDHERDEAAVKAAMEGKLRDAKIAWEKNWGEEARRVQRQRLEAEAAARGPAANVEGAKGSAFLGGPHGGAMQMNAADDDDEGWITAGNMKTELAAGGSGGGIQSAKVWAAGAGGPTRAAACVTTDYAMQNVLLQMNVPLLSLQGRVVRKVKRWVLRCAACHKLVSDMTRLFCPTCGNATLERMACTMNAKTGKTYLHFAKPGKRRNDIRGTKYSIPQGRKGDGRGARRFEGDILLREDQLMNGIWRQKVQRSAGEERRAKGRVLDVEAASNFMTDANLRNNANLAFGLGRRNPNAKKGRERRGAKQKKRR